jgi:hypothetical protein
MKWGFNGQDYLRKFNNNSKKTKMSKFNNLILIVIALDLFFL